MVIIIISIFPNTVFSDTVHDPTAPKIFGNVDSAGTFNRATAAVEEELTLQGIVNKKDTRMAIISGQLHRVGEMVNGYKISQVNNNNVVLTKSGSQKRLYVYE
ncbi:hypothetical protein Q4575_01780 [Psychrosphaera sp. 1_MG-2023]|uniref:hypothetical protein n=1 Tax=Psychrosphaera sp. 1_MG-2023 TaxID=3062643 RepID=UPI0026E25651|nr:hypothetical protein [Psychrosphaera sp. 1_MG-2023]MDO6718108.1 hypothetical protein [Psychrosphaera sp. 1_MG-2023]